MLDSKMKVGLVGLIHPCMQGDDLSVHNRILSSMEKLKDELGFELVIIREPFNSEEDGQKARKILDSKKVDLTMVFNSSLGLGRAILQVCRVNSFLGIWALPEPVHSGILQLNSFCGLNMNAAIIDSYFKEYDIPFKWFYGYPEDELFLERFKITLTAIKAIKTLRQSRIGLIGDIAEGFENLVFDERDLEKRFGTYIYTRHSVEDIVERAKTIDSLRADALTEIMGKEGVWRKENVGKEDMGKLARVNLALEDFANENNYNAIAINCWTKFQQYYDIAICAALSRLNEAGIVASCEGDVPGALNMLMLNSITNSSSTLVDLVALDERDDSACLWHCGPAPKSLANEAGVSWDAHCIFGGACGEKWCGKGVVADVAFKPGDITIARTNSSFTNLFVMNAQIMESKKGYAGSSGWMNHMKISGAELAIPELIETLITNRIDHHYPVAYGNASNALYEVANWLKLDIIEPAPYKPYMQNAHAKRS